MKKLEIIFISMEMGMEMEFGIYIIVLIMKCLTIICL